MDTGAFLAAIRKRDRDHVRVGEHFARLQRERAQLITVEPVIAETATRLRYDADVRAVLTFRQVLDDAVSVGALRVREGDPRLRQAAFELMARFDALPLSFADCVGAVVAQEVRADAVFGLDSDFTIMGFALEPA